MLNLDYISWRNGKKIDVLEYDCFNFGINFHNQLKIQTIKQNIVFSIFMQGIYKKKDDSKIPILINHYCAMYYVALYLPKKGTWVNKKLQYYTWDRTLQILGMKNKISLFNYTSQQ